MYVVPNLLTFVAVDCIRRAFKATASQIAQKSVKFNTAMGRTGQATAPQATRGHIEGAAILLHHNIGTEFCGAKQGMTRRINTKIFGNPVRILEIVVVPPCFQFLEGYIIGRIAVNLVGAEKYKRRFRGMLPVCL